VLGTQINPNVFCERPNPEHFFNVTHEPSKDTPQIPQNCLKAPPKSPLFPDSLKDCPKIVPRNSARPPHCKQTSPRPAKKSTKILTKLSTSPHRALKNPQDGPKVFEEQMKLINPRFIECALFLQSTIDPKPRSLQASEFACLHTSNKQLRTKRMPDLLILWNIAETLEDLRLGEVSHLQVLVHVPAAAKGNSVQLFAQGHYTGRSPLELA